MDERPSAAVLLTAEPRLTGVPHASDVVSPVAYHRSSLPRVPVRFEEKKISSPFLLRDANCSSNEVC